MDFSTGIPINSSDLETVKAEAAILGIVISTGDLGEGGGLDTEIGFSPIHPKASKFSDFLWKLQMAFCEKQ